MQKIRDLSKSELEEETLIYRFLHQINIVTDTEKRLRRKGSNLGIKLTAKKGAPLKTEFSAPHLQTITELAVVIEPLVRAPSAIHYAAILSLCRNQTESPDLGSLITDAEADYEGIKKGNIKIDLNGEQREPEWIYEHFMDKFVNADDVAARKHEEKLNRNPVTRDLLLFQFYNYCMEMISFVVGLRELLKSGRFLPKGKPRDYLCIICRHTGDKATFSKVEHTLPESLGNTHSVLPRGYCCDECQNTMAPVEGTVVNSAPFAMTRLWFTKHTKSGTFPGFKGEAVHYQKTKLNHIRMDSFAGKKAMPTVKHTGDGKIRFTLTSTSKFDHIALGRVLVKATLGAMALEKGREYVLNPRFDPARQFILTSKGLHARLLMNKHATPTSQTMVQWHDSSDHGAGVMIRIHGVEFAFAATPVVYEGPPPQELLKETEVFNLWNSAPAPHYRMDAGATD